MNGKGRRNIFGIICICLALNFCLGCGKLPYMPDESAMIFLSAIPSSIQTGQTATILIMGEKGSGYPLPDGTIVFLFASTGKINNEISLIEGKAEATFTSDIEYVGEVNITAHSGQATISPEQLIIIVTEIVEPDIAYLFISADPMELPQTGGKSDISVLAVDEEMQPIAGKNIWLETTAGSLSGNGIYTTGNNGYVNATLSTDMTATVTAKYKELSSSVIVTVEAE